MTERDWQKDWDMCQMSPPRPPWSQTSIEARDFIIEAGRALPYWLKRVRDAEDLLKRAKRLLLLLICLENDSDECKDWCGDHPCEPRKLYNEIRAFLKEDAK